MLEACNSGVAASLPIMVIFAKEERGALLVKVRDRGAAVRRARRVRKEDILRFWVRREMDGCCGFRC